MKSPLPVTKALAIILLGSVIVSSAQAQLTIALTADSASSTTLTVTVSGSVTTNASGTWSSSGASTNWTSFTDFFNVSFSDHTFALSQAIILTNQTNVGNDISLATIFLDNDGGSSTNDDFALSPGSSAGYLSGETYSASGSATFDISGVGTFGSFTVPYSGTLASGLGGLQGFGSSNAITTAIAVPEPETTAALFGVMTIAAVFALRRRRK